MTLDQFTTLMTGEKHDDREYLKFNLVENRHSNRPDLHAFILIDRLLPGLTEDIVSCSCHDEFFLGVDCEELAAVITEEQVIELIRCGVRYDSNVGSLAMFA